MRLYEPGLSGHASGKTTFCRILRHVLGEKHFANELVTRGVRETFEGGWVLGEVFINSDLWLVGRPFTLGAHTFCVRGSTINEYLRDKPPHQPFPIYLDELEKATVNSLSVKTLPKSGETVQWPHLLQWLTRDQECRFIQLTDWRSKLSKSEAPDIPADDQHSLMRAVVGVLSEEERGEIEKNAKLNREKETATAEVPILQRQAETDHQRLELALERQLPTPDNPLLVDSVKTELSDMLNEKDSEIRDLDNGSEVIRLQQEREAVLKRTTETETELRFVDARLSELTTRLQMHERKKTNRSAFDFAAQIPPGVGYCRVRIDEAKEKGCSLAFDQPRDLGSERVLKSIEDRGSEIQHKINDLSERKNSLTELLGLCLEQESIANKRLVKQRTDVAAKRHELYNQRAELLDRVKLAQRSHDTWLKAAKLTQHIQDLESEIQVSRDKQQEYRESSKRAVRDLSMFYQEIVRAVLGNSVSGAIQLSGREFTCKIERNGDLSSGAIDTIKILAFDLAALAASCSGQGNHPRFLLHDSPREADMAPLTYKRLFLWARKLEDAFNDQPCNFQYIITTTEAPPEDLQTDPWLLDPVLDASQPDKRLLGVDL